MFSTAARVQTAHTILAAAFVLCLAVAAPRAEANDAALFRIFLLDGESVVSYGEFARVGNRVVFSVPIGETPETLTLQLVSIPDTTVDWPRTNEYAAAVRAKRYADTRGEEDFTLLTSRVVQALNEINAAADPKRRIAMAEEARQNLAAWPAANHGYRAADVAQLVSMLDDVVADMRAGAGETQFELSLVATTTPPAHVPLLPPPDRRESLEAGFRAALAAADPAERIALLRTIARELSSAPESAAWAPALRERASAALAAELRVEHAYTDLVQSSMKDAASRAARADVRGLQQIIARALAADDRLGNKRSGEMASLLAALDLRLDEARRLRLARDAWEARQEVFRKYRRAITGPRRRMDGFRARLQQIRDLSGPAVRHLQPLEIHATLALHELVRVEAPPELQSAHGLLVAALQMARNAASLRRNAVSSKDIKLAWDASSAAAGALMLAERAADELKRLTSDSIPSPR